MEDLLLSILVFNIYFVLSYFLLKKNNNKEEQKWNRLSYLDVFWALSFLIPFIYNFIVEGFNHGNIIFFLLVLLWSFRLSIYLYRRIQVKGEDLRYRSIVSNINGSVNFGVFKIFIFQALVSTVIAMPLFVYLNSPSAGWSSPSWNVPVLLFFFIGFTIECLSDYQLTAFKRKKPKEVCNVGLWKFIDHPNYLGEVIVWISFFLFALPFTYGYLAVISPITLYLVLRFISGANWYNNKIFKNKKNVKLKLFSF